MKSLKPIFIILIFSLTFMFGSCKIQNLMQSSNIETNNEDLFSTENRNYEYTIQPEDKLSISIWGHDDLSVGSVFGIYNSNEVYGKWVLVDRDGGVALPQLGQVKVADLTTRQLTDSLKLSYSKFIKKPIIVVKVLNKRVSLLGAVKQASSMILDEDQMPLLELIAKAEGFDYYADRSQVKLIREKDGLPKEYIIDLTQMGTYEQSNILIRPGDVIYVPNKNGKAFDKKSNRMLPFFGVISSLAVFISVVK
jgi:polysaccharide export outer membrane protein